MQLALVRRYRLAPLALVVGCAALAACSPKPPEDLPPAPAAPSVSSNTPQPMLQGPAPGSEADFMASMAGQDVIHFDYDKFNIDATDAAALQAQARWLARYPYKRATIEGHADERGTREYNFALGARRAESVKAYLISKGISASRIKTVSYGKERPVATCNDISCWSQNRRAVTVLNGGNS